MIRKKKHQFIFTLDLKLYSTVRSWTLVDCLFQLGICISYDRILSITKSLYEALGTTFGHYKVFLQTNLKKGFFTVFAKDNIDKNATANLVQSHFLGTGISLFRLFDHENQGESKSWLSWVCWCSLQHQEISSTSSWIHATKEGLSFFRGIICSTL